METSVRADATIAPATAERTPPQQSATAEGTPPQQPAGEAALHFDAKTAHKTLADWRVSTERMRVAHREAAVSYGRLSRGMGATVAVLSAAVGTSAFAQLTTNGPAYVTIIAGALGMLAAALAAAQTALGYGAMHEAHRAAAAQQAQLHIEMEELWSSMPGKGQQSKVKRTDKDEEWFDAEFDRIGKEYARADANSPEIAERFVVKARQILDARRHW